MIERFVFLARRPDLTHAQFIAHWQDVHGPIAAQIATLEAYEQYDVAPGGAPPPPTPHLGFALDGVARLVFADLEAVEEGFTPEIVAQLVADEEEFIGALSIVTVSCVQQTGDAAQTGFKLLQLWQAGSGKDPAGFQRQMLAQRGGPALKALETSAGHRRLMTLGAGLTPVNEPLASDAAAHMIDEFDFSTAQDLQQALAANDPAQEEAPAGWPIRLGAHVTRIV